MKKEYENVQIVVQNLESCDVLTISGGAEVVDSIWSENPWGGVGNYFKEAVVE